jgi:hypothetical protein
VVDPTLGALHLTDPAKVLARAAEKLGVPVPSSDEARVQRVARAIDDQLPMIVLPLYELDLVARAAIAAYEPSFTEPMSRPYMSGVSDILQGLSDRLMSHETKLDRVLSLCERILAMSSTLDTDAVALTTAVTGLTVAINNQGSVITNAVTEIQTLLASGPPDAAALTAITNATSAIATATNSITNAGSTLAAAIPAPIINTGT